MAEIKIARDWPAGTFEAPSIISSTVVFLPTVTVLDVLRVVMSGFIERYGVEADYWQAGQRGEEHPEHPGLPSAADLTSLESAGIRSACLFGRFKDAYAFAVAQILDHEQGEKASMTYGHRECVTLTLSSGDLSGDETPERVRRVIDSRVALLRELIGRFPVLHAHLYRNANNYAPSPPYFDPHKTFYIACRDKVAACYDDPEVYWRSWDTMEPLDDNRVLVTKALAIEDELAFKQAVYPRTWEPPAAPGPGSPGITSRRSGFWTVRSTRRASPRSPRSATTPRSTGWSTPPTRPRAFTSCRARSCCSTPCSAGGRSIPERR